MSVLIKGMDMPKGCSYCTLLYRGSDERYHCPFNSFCVWLDFDDIPDYIVDDDCPLVEVPTPHGRLIDADKQWEVCKELVNDVLFPMGSVDEAEIVGMVKNARTIIESEE